MTKLQEKEQAIPAGDSTGQFLREIRSIPMLTQEEERLLARRCAAGDEDAIFQMVNANLRLVVSVAREYAGRGVPLQDLIQEGSIGLLMAARKFDHRMDYRFSTYATKWIRRGVIRCLISHTGLIRVPEDMAELMHRIQAARLSLGQETGAEPTAEAIGEKCGLSADRVRKIMALEPEICSLDLPAGEADDGTLGALIEDATTAQPQEELIRRELLRYMDELLDALDPRQRRILRLHFGMEDGVCHSLEKIGKELGISKERVRQIKGQAMEKLQKLGADMGLEDFLE